MVVRWVALAVFGCLGVCGFCEFVCVHRKKKKRKKKFHLYNLALENLIFYAENQREKNN